MNIQLPRVKALIDLVGRLISVDLHAGVLSRVHLVSSENKRHLEHEQIPTVILCLNGRTSRSEEGFLFEDNVACLGEPGATDYVSDIAEKSMETLGRM